MSYKLDFDALELLTLQAGLLLEWQRLEKHHELTPERLARLRTIQNKLQKAIENVGI